TWVLEDPSIIDLLFSHRKPNPSERTKPTFSSSLQSQKQHKSFKLFVFLIATTMVEGKQEVLVVHAPKDLMQNPITQLQTKFKELENGFKGWLAQQSLPVEAAVVTITGAAQGAAIGGFMGTLTNDVATSFPAAPPPGASLNPQTMASFQQAQALSGGPFIQARNFAVMTGVNAGISGMGGPNQAANVITSGVFFALLQGGLFKVGEKFSKPPVEDVLYNKTRFMLSSLGLENYEKNFKKGLLSDNTLPLLTDRNKEVKKGGRWT
ncbi:hypothetical protein Ccrd_014010, partial [Cynara cardunculus var. scolymus]